MHQEIFSDIEYSFRKKKTKREEFIALLTKAVTRLQQVYNRHRR